MFRIIYALKNYNKSINRINFKGLQSGTKGKTKIKGSYL